MTTTSYGLEDKGTTTITTTSRVIETCATIYGCAVSDYDEATATDDTTCSLGRRTAPAALVHGTTATPGPNAPQPTVTSSPELVHESLDTRSDALIHLSRRVDENNPAAWGDDIRLATEWFCSRNDVIIFAKSVWDFDGDTKALADRLEKLKNGQTRVKVVRAQSTKRELTAFWYVSGLPTGLHAKLLQMKAVEVMYDPSSFRTRAWYPGTGMDIIQARSVDDDEGDLIAEEEEEEPVVGPGIAKRLVTQYTDWANSHISTPPEADDWATNTDFTVNPGASQDNSLHKYYFHESAGQQQYIYVVESCVDTKHPEFIGIRVASPLKTQNWGLGYTDDCVHGTAVSALAVGQNLGVARRAILVPVHTGTAFERNSDPAERYLEALVLVLDDILDTNIPKEGKAVVSMSWQIGAGSVPKAYGRVMRTVLEEIASEGVVLVAASGNGRKKGFNSDGGYPQRVIGQGHLTESSLVVGATDGAARLAGISERFSDNKLNRIIHAPGDKLKVVVAGGSHKWSSGTSYSALKVAGLVAYYRGLPSR
ncbi:peptidase S8/S53 domain-containing protein [Microdochium trichocladiopsis]|uniref:Peptidase S8/S53 domain-containing protein n=1 Tax=Microdochium trichocladiopsis TaxID=1682393 RepID=A0A9P8Y5Z9_9PEZI|nr:peptidase S8/S53 domain-containing protein [Microdochium trichocladiopsis]KAH7030553.1 peptidase S8/S53 domain-containing protein [Microdochium trichocladiopsis]